MALAENKKDRLKVWLEVQGGRSEESREPNKSSRFALKLGTRPRITLDPSKRKRIVIRVTRVRAAEG